MLGFGVRLWLIWLLEETWNAKDLGTSNLLHIGLSFHAIQDSRRQRPDSTR